MLIRIKPHFVVAVIILTFCILPLTGCMKSTPKRTVQSYLQFLSGERQVTEAGLESLTTSNYRNSDHPHLASIAEEQRERIDIAGEFLDDPAIRQVIELVTWETTYDIVREDESSATVVARVIMTERKPGDLETAKEIPDLPEPYADLLVNGLELPFQFELKKEDKIWKIDHFTVPEVLQPILDITGVTENM